MRRSCRQRVDPFIRYATLRYAALQYAVLVSLLEPDSVLYNTGIVDVFHRFPKMYIVRPQFFLPIITLLRNAAMNCMRPANTR